mgnify:CR=1 FL=1
MATDDEQKRLEAAEKAAQDRLKLERELTRQAIERLKISDQSKAAAIELINLQRSGVEITNEHVEGLHKSKAKQKEILALVKERAEHEQGFAKIVEESNERVKTLVKNTESAAKSTEAWAKVVGSLSAGFAKISGIDLKNVFDNPLSLVGEFYELATALDTAGVGLGRLNGQVGMNKAAISGLVERNKDLAINQQEAAKIQGELFTSYSDFFFMSQDMQEQTANLGATFERLGLSSQDLGGFMDKLTRGMGFSKEAALGASESLANFASKMGVPPKELAADFNSLASELAKYGTKGVDVFKTLQKTAKSLAMNVKDAMKIATLFDTFSGAAKAAGLLNAQLGLGLNAVSLMKADEGERLEILRQRFKAQGKEFDSLHRRERQAIASMLGIEVGLASRLFGDKASWDEVQQNQEDARERAQKLTEIVDKLKVVFLQMAPALEEAAEWLRSVVTWFSEHTTVLKWVVGITALAGSIWLLLPILKGVAMAWSAWTTTAAASAPAMAAASAGALPLSLAILAIGAGVGIAAFGMSYLVAEFAKMDPVQILASAVGMLALAGSMWVFSGAVIALVPVLPALAAGMLTLGAILGGFGLLALAGVLAMNSLGNSFVKIGEGLAQAASAMSELSFSQFTGMSSALGSLRDSLSEFIVLLATMGISGRNRPIRRAVKPLVVRAMSAFARAL